MSLINDIESWACEIAGTPSPVDPAARSLIRQWSAFTPYGTDKVIDIGQKPLAQISEKYVNVIYGKAQKAINAHRKASGTSGQLDLGVPEKMVVRAQERATRPIYDGPENRPSDLPF